MSDLQDVPENDTGELEIESHVDGPMPDWLKVASSSKGSSMDEAQVPDWLRSIRAGAEKTPVEAKGEAAEESYTSTTTQATDDGMSDLERLLAKEGIDLGAVSEERPEGVEGVSSRDRLISTSNDELVRKKLDTAKPKVKKSVSTPRKSPPKTKSISLPEPIDDDKMIVEDDLPDWLRDISAEAQPEAKAQLEPDLINRLSPPAHQAVGTAIAVGNQIGKTMLVTETLLMGLNQEENGATQAILTAFGLPPQKFYQWINQQEGLLLSVESIEKSVETSKDINISAVANSENVNIVLKRAAQIVGERPSDQIQPRHLLLGLLENENCVAYRWLNQMGLPIAQIRNILAQVPEEAPIVSSMFAYSASSAFADTAARQDALGFEMHAQALAEIIVKPETMPPVVIGVYGPWGSGKSTFMALVQKHLEAWDNRQHPAQAKPGLWSALKRLFRQATPPPQPSGPQPRVVCVYFNAWAYTDADKLWTGLVERISPYLDDQIPWWKKPFFWLGRNGWRFLGAVILGLSPLVAGLVVMYLLSLWEQIQQWEWVVNFVTWLTAIGGSIKVFANQKPLTQAIGALISQYDPTDAEGVMSQVHEEFKKTVKDYFLLSEKDKTPSNEAQVGPDQPELKKVRQNKLKVVVMIDELDRCPLEKMVDILEAIKIFLAEEIFIVLMAVDTRVIAEAIRLHYKDVKNPNLAREYLEKIIQIPVQVPEANEQQLANFVNSLMAVTAEETSPDQQKVEVGTRASVTPVEVRPPAERGLLAVSADLFNPLQLSDTAVEREAITAFALAYLDSNPRRIKRLLNTYRYVKILATRQGERTDQEEWQEKMMNWLGFTMRWPTFMARAIREGRLPAENEANRELLARLNTDLPSRQQPPAEAFRFKLPNSQEIARFEELADNFIVESPPEVVAPPQGMPVRTMKAKDKYRNEKERSILKNS